MSIANWNPTAYYLVGDYVYDGSGDDYFAVANNHDDPPPSASWVLVTTGTFSPSYAEIVSNTTIPLPATFQTTITFSAKNIGTPDVTLPNPSNIRVGTTGVYRVIFSAQLEKTMGGGTDEIQMWFTINGNNVPNSNSKVDLTQQINAVMTIESIFSLTAGDTIGLRGYTPATAVSCFVVAIPVDANHPVSIPSVIVDVQRIA
jgi:hypothetical protein